MSYTKEEMNAAIAQAVRAAVVSYFPPDAFAIEHVL